MGYPKEFAHKLAHCPLVANEEVRKTVAACSVVPSSAPPRSPVAGVQPMEPAAELSAELDIYAIDGSRWELNLDRKNHRLGYLQIGQVAFSLEQYAALAEGSRVDPFATARLLQQRQAWGVSLPSSRVRWGTCTSVRDSIRAVLEGFLTQTRPFTPEFSLRETLFALASERLGPLATGDDRFLRLHKCPDCEKGPVVVTRSLEEPCCPHCKARVYASDCLRIYEEVRESDSNENAFTRTMLVLEHLILMNHLETLAQTEPARLAHSVWFMDGPLALFGPASWLHAPIQARLHEMNKRLCAAGFMTLVGIEKTGRLVKHAHRLEMPRRSILAVDDDYRYRRVVLARAPNRAGFGRQTHYGQDFIYRNGSGQKIVFSLPYSAARKSSPLFDEEKADLKQYAQLPQVLALLERLSSKRHPASVVPTLLAHQATAISRRPGGDVLKLLSKQMLKSCA